MREINNLIQEIEELCKPLWNWHHYFDWISKIYKLDWYISLDFNSSWTINITKSNNRILYKSEKSSTSNKYWIDLLELKKEAIIKNISEKLESIKKEEEERELAILKELKLKYENAELIEKESV